MRILSSSSSIVTPIVAPWRLALGRGRRRRFGRGRVGGGGRATARSRRGPSAGAGAAFAADASAARGAAVPGAWAYAGVTSGADSGGGTAIAPTAATRLAPSTSRRRQRTRVEKRGHRDCSWNRSVDLHWMRRERDCWIRGSCRKGSIGCMPPCYDRRRKLLARRRQRAFAINELRNISAGFRHAFRVACSA